MLRSVGIVVGFKLCYRMDAVKLDGIVVTKSCVVSAFEGVPEAIVEILWAVGIIWESHQSLGNSSWFASKRMDRSLDFICALWGGF